MFKIYAKADIRVFWPSSILIDILVKYFVQDYLKKHSFARNLVSFKQQYPDVFKNFQVFVKHLMEI